MALHPDEEATLCAFVVSARRDRLLSLFGNPKRRKKALDGLNHFTDWDARYATQIDSSVPLDAIAQQLKAAGKAFRSCRFGRRRLDAIAQQLKAAGAGDQCRLISDNPGLDGQELRLEEALDAAGSAYFASLLCCKPGMVAFFFDEVFGPRIRTLLRRPGHCSAHNPL